MAKQNHAPYHPIIYVRGFAATQGEIEQTVADPYMGFNIGSTKSRRAWTGEVKRYYFESPLVRLMGDYGYEDVYEDGDDLLASSTDTRPIPYRCIAIHRYYDEASKDFGNNPTPPITHFAEGLDRLILRLRDRVCGNKANGVAPKDFRVHLVAHSMGGLVCRTFLQNPKHGSAEARALVDRLYTYATPHNGIDMRVVRNVPGWITFGDVNNFNRDKMASYLAVPKGDDVSVVKNFPPERIFNLVGTNPGDYDVAMGIASWAIGDASDGLVRIANATTHGPGAGGKDVTSPRAFVHRSHSGNLGIVNSEEGYQNLVRFLFGSLRVDGVLDLDELSFPEEVQKLYDAGKEVRASYQVEVSATPRACQWEMTRRIAKEQSAIFRTYDELFPKNGKSKRKPDRAKSPHLFSLFLDPSKSVQKSGSVSFGFDLKILVPDYVVDGNFFMKRHYEGGFIYRSLILVEAFPDAKAVGGWRIKYGYQDSSPNRADLDAVTSAIDRNDPEAGLTFSIPVQQAKCPGVSGNLRIEVRPWK